MTPLKCIAIDDEPLALELMRKYIAKFPQLQLVQTFEDAISGAEFLKQNAIDLLFVDINMPDITGIDLVRSLVNRPMVIFTTAYKNFAFEGFELEAIDYLLKPIDIGRFGKAVEKAVDFQQYKKKQADPAQQESLYVYSEYRMVKVNLADIEYIESMEDYIKIHTSKDAKPVLTLMPLKKALEKLPADQFQRVHRSYVVAVGKIRSVQNRKIQLANAELPISDSYSAFAKEWVKK
ncbi:LytR/AlgR family response regulator transcription factor [Mucilaginibacter myungsuensis]|uniref:Response regulator transcription factor n=1 Tax=Mucilaginibacter myungsuensis TaxID=649104 RepID=A0A929KYJ1_9SPHI|nr:LytTR family DNA-binding domain-containing protein [Mucilaginibacter myungsuensis]MBE9660960.1 response regulator transcription factor [Mucilaginibacter myungsuensis]MDN3601006.1 LytTR family DNA-binding domain-containing protein [Mucilaginibacter myungsuensis]